MFQGPSLLASHFTTRLDRARERHEWSDSEWDRTIFLMKKTGTWMAQMFLEVIGMI